MRRVCVYTCALLAGALVSFEVCQAGGVCRSQRVVVKQQAAVFAAVPFAVPVAVPVAAVVQPTYLYAYGAYSARVNPPAAQAPTGTNPAAEMTEDESAALDRRAVEVLTRRCVSCHSGEGAGGDLVFADEDGNVAKALPRHRMLKAIESGKMPPPEKAKPLEADEIEAIRHWARLPRDLVY